MGKRLAEGDRVALTRRFLGAMPSSRRYELATLRGEVLAVVGAGYLVVVQWDGVPDEQANHTYNEANLCRPRSVAFTE